MIKAYFNRSPFIAFLPFLSLYVFIVVLLHKDLMEGDEGRYYQFATNLLHGFYSPAAPHINIWNGPGYPILLMPFVFFKAPLIAITLLNALFYYFSVVLIFLSLKRYASLNLSVLLSLLFAFYYPAFEEMYLIYTECFTIFLLSAIIFCFTELFRTRSRKHVYLTGFLIGFLVLTKVAFGYVLLVALAASGIYFLLKRSYNSKRLLICVAIAMLVNLPYLIYTFWITKKAFYWANSGGVSLYWMSTPYKGEFGDWHSEGFDADCGNEANPELLPCSSEIFKKLHGSEISYVNQFGSLQKDSVYKSLAFMNIRQHPAKFLQNCVSNVGRLFFNYPYTYTYQKTSSLYRLPACSIVFVLMLASMIPTFRNWKKIPLEIRCLLFFLAGYLGVSIIVSAYSRQLSVVMPVFILWFGYIFTKTMKIQLKFSGT